MFRYTHTLVVSIFSIICFSGIGQSVVRMEYPEEPVYKIFNPDTSKLLLTREDVSDFCNGVNISKEDSSYLLPLKLWSALTDPLNYQKFYGQTGVYMSGDYKDPLQANWAKKSEEEYTKFVLFERFYVPNVNFSYVIDSVNTVDEFINENLARMSAFKKLNETGAEYEKCIACKKTALAVLKENEKVLNRYDYAILIVHPKEKYGWGFSNYNVLTVKRTFIDKVIAVFAKLGLKTTELEKLKLK